MKNILILSLVGTMIAASSCTDGDLGPLNQFPDEQDPISYDWDAAADSIQSATYNTFLSSEGTYRENNQGSERFHYWWNSHMLDVLVDGYLRTGDENYLPRMKALLRGIHIKNGNRYENVFNDDMQWLGIASLRAYQATGDEEYKEVAVLLWDEIIKSWSDLLGGGITWKSDEPLGKNACSNGPAAIMAGLLYQADGNPEYLDWTKRIFDWLKTTLVDPQNGIVWDNVKLEDGQTVFNRDWVFTYNQGSFIGAATLLYELTGESGYLNDALRTANTTTRSPQLTTEGLLKNENQGDGGLFKGVLVRYFNWLILQEDLPEGERAGLVNFMKFNAETFYTQGLGRPGMMASPDWRQRPGGNTDLSTQLSGVMLIEAAAQLEEEGLLE